MRLVWPRSLPVLPLLTSLLASLPIQASPLTEEEARIRAETFGSVRYALNIDLATNPDLVQGKARIRFHLNQASDASFLCFRSEGKVRSLKIDGKSVSPITHENDRIMIPLSGLQPTEHEIEVEYEIPYNDSDLGFVKVTQPDGSVFVHTNLQTHEAGWLFPGFHQPSMKGRQALSLLTPRLWQVATFALPDSSSEEGPHQRWTFRETAHPIPSSVYPLTAGPFHVWEDKSAEPPLRLLARPEFAPHVKSDEWFQATRIAIQAASDLFGIPLPITKYDQAIVPGMGSYAMENFAASVFSEAQIPRGRMSAVKKIEIITVTIHELLHHWFGNYFSPVWWDDLWLNESVVTFLSYVIADAHRRELGISNPWLHYFYDAEDWGYTEDALPTRHPICREVPDTDFADANFTGITYGKGAAVLRQIYHYIGREKFLRGFQAFLREFAWKNASRRDFLKKLEEAAGVSLARWESAWLNSEGTNSLGVTHSGDRLTVAQVRGAGSPRLHPHQTTVGVFQKNGAGLALVKEASVQIASASKTATIEGLSDLATEDKPILIVPDAKNETVAHWNLDPVSTETAKKHLSAVENEMVRLRLWHTFSTQVEDSEMSPFDWIGLVERHLPPEDEPIIWQYVLDRLITASQFTRRENRAFILQRIETFLLAELVTAAAGSDRQLILFEELVRFVSSDEGLTRVEAWLDGSETLPGLEIDQSRRWDLIYALSRTGQPNVQKAQERIEAELERDGGVRGRVRAVACLAALPDQKRKQRWLEIALGTHADSGQYSFEERKVAMANFYILGQESLTDFARDRFLSDLDNLLEAGASDTLEAFARSMFPEQCEVSLAHAVREKLDGEARLTPLAAQYLRDGHHRALRRIRSWRSDTGLPEHRTLPTK